MGAVLLGVACFATGVWAEDQLDIVFRIKRWWEKRKP